MWQGEGDGRNFPGPSLCQDVYRYNNLGEALPFLGHAKGPGVMGFFLHWGLLALTLKQCWKTQVTE